MGRETVTFSLVICSDPPEAALPVLRAFTGFGERFEAITLSGYPVILDAYRDGLKKATHDLVVFAHNDLLPLTHGIEETLLLAFKNSDAAWISGCGSLRPLACGCVFHMPWEAVGSMTLGLRGGMWSDRELEGRVLSGVGPRWDALGLMREVAMVDAAFLATMRHDWEMQPSQRSGFFSGYDADISYEAVSKKQRLFVLPLPLSHWGAMPTAEECTAKDQEFRRGITSALLARWKDFTVPCAYGGPPPMWYCPACEPSILERDHA